VQVPGAPRFVLTFTPQNFLSIKQFVHYLCQETGLIQQQTSNQDVQILTKPSYLLMLEDSILLNMTSIRDGDRVSMIPASSLNNYVAGLAHANKEKEANPNPQANVLPCTPMLPKLPPSLQSLQEQISQATQPLRDMQALQSNLPKPQLTPQNSNSNSIEVGTTQTVADLKPEQQSQFRPSPQMHLFKVISSMLPRDITQQVKQAAL